MKPGERTSLAKTIEIKEIEANYWKDSLQKRITDQEMKKLAANLDLMKLKSHFGK
jgi:hypothetical protein